MPFGQTRQAAPRSCRVLGSSAGRRGDNDRFHPQNVGQVPAGLATLRKSADTEGMSTDAAHLIELLQENISRVVLGKADAVRLVVVALLAGEHVLLEDIPGVGKTLMGKAIARSLAAQFHRIQFTPDLLPADITGSSLYNGETREFVFSPGPIFANVVLADEINRATPRTQSALLESMSEGQVSADGQTHPLPRPFMVIATQNPIEFEGTYPLPESQLDRFLLRIPLGYPQRDVELQVLSTHREGEPVERLAAVCDCEQVTALQAAVRQVQVEDSINEYLLDIVQATRRCGELHVGVSTRGALAFYRAAQAAGPDRRSIVRGARRREAAGGARAGPSGDPQGLSARRSARGDRSAHRAAGRGSARAGVVIMLRRPTTIHREGWYYLLITAIVFGGALFKEVNLLLILAGMLLGPVLLNWQAVGINLPDCSIDRKLPRGLSAGDWLSVGLHLSNARRRLGTWAVVVQEQIERVTAAAGNHHGDPPACPEVLFPYVPAGQSRKGGYRGRLLERGRYRFGPCSFPRGFPLGCFRGRSPWASARRSSSCPAWDA